MPRIDFATLVFQGARFNGDAMPVEVLPELSAYRDVIVAVARSLFQQRNPDRVRLPKGFEKTLRLVLARVESGSSVVDYISRETDSTNLFPDIFDEARDLVEEGIASVGAGRMRDTRLSPEVLARFSSLGRSLGPEERIVINRPGRNGGAVYNREVRNKILRAAQTSYVDIVDIVGEVRAADKDAEGFAVRTFDGRKIEVKAPPLFIPLAVHSLKESAQVRVRGSGVYDATGRLERVDLATDVSLAEEDESTSVGSTTSIRDQVARLAALTPGWYDETSTPYGESGLRWAEALISGLINAFRLPTPYLYPTPDMAIRAEWTASNLEVLLTLVPASKTGSALAIHINSDDVDEFAFVNGEPGAESALGTFLRKALERS